MNRAVFLDRDGVLNESVVVNGKPFPPSALDDFRLIPGVTSACVELKRAGYLLIVVTNQPDIGRGTQSESVVDSMHKLLYEQIPVDAIYVCPHGGVEPCECRKPKPGMLVSAAEKFDIDLANSFMVGDRWRDVDCGAAAGCTTVFIDYGYREDLRTKPDHITSSLSEAVVWILNQPSD